MGDQGIPYLGCKISLISKSEIRYEGVLFTVDSKESTLTLSKVRSFGTEDRPTNQPLPARNEVYEYIIFRASDIKDLSVSESPKAPGIYNDPAILSVSQPASTRDAAPSFGLGMVNTLHGSSHGHNVSGAGSLFSPNAVGTKSFPNNNQQGSAPSSRSATPVGMNANVSAGSPPTSFDNYRAPGTGRPAARGGRGGSSNREAGFSSHDGFEAHRKPFAQVDNRRISGNRSAGFNEGFGADGGGGGGGFRSYSNVVRDQREQRGGGGFHGQSDRGDRDRNHQEQQHYQQQRHAGRSAQLQALFPAGERNSVAGRGRRGGGMVFRGANANAGGGGYGVGGNYHNINAQGGGNFYSRGNRGTGRSWGGRARNSSAGGGTQRGTASEPLKFDTDYDFEGETEKFIQETMDKLKSVDVSKAKIGLGSKEDVDNNSDGHEAESASDDESAEEEEATEPQKQEKEHQFYDKTRSFFDKISCEALEKQQGQQEKHTNNINVHRRRERELNTETFGQSSLRGFGRGFRGRGGYRGRGGGGFYRHRGFSGQFKSQRSQ